MRTINPWKSILMIFLFLTFAGTVYYFVQEEDESLDVLGLETSQSEANSATQKSAAPSSAASAAKNSNQAPPASNPGPVNPPPGMENAVDDGTLTNDNNPQVPNPEDEKSDSDGFKFAIIGDTQRFEPGKENGDFQKAAGSIKNQNVNLVLSVGDLLSSCDGTKKCEDKYSSWKEIVNPIVSSIYQVQGNYDRSNGEKSDLAWQNSFNLPENGPEGYKELVYSFDYDNSHFVALGSENPKEHIVNQVQREWLEKDLKDNKKDNIFVFFHEPAYPVSSKIGESLDAKPEERDALWEIFKKYKVTAVFNGHEHIASRKYIDGIYQFVFGNTDSFNHDKPKDGVAEYSYQGEHYGIAKVKGKNITVETYAVDGKILDTFEFKSGK